MSDTASNNNQKQEKSSKIHSKVETSKPHQHTFDTAVDMGLATGNSLFADETSSLLSNGAPGLATGAISPFVQRHSDTPSASETPPTFAGWNFAHIPTDSPQRSPIQAKLMGGQTNQKVAPIPMSVMNRPTAVGPILQRFDFSEEQMANFSEKQNQERDDELANLSSGIQHRQKNNFLNEKQQADGFKVIYDGSLGSLAEALFKSPNGIRELSDTDLVNILKTTFGSDWFKAKKCLTTDFWPGVTGSRPPHNVSIKLMQALVDMRGRVWDQFVKNVQPKIRKEVAVQKAKGILLSKISTPPQDQSLSSELKNLNNPRNLDSVSNEDETITKQGNFGLKEAVGSESVTSDIDLSAKGENTEIGVAMINAEFRAIYGTEPGTFFDINVYSSDWMFKPEEEIVNKVVKKTPASEAKASTGQDLNIANQKRKDDRNEIWSMVKIRRNMGQDDWDTYKEQLLFSLSSPTSQISPQQAKEESAKRADMVKKFGEVDKEYAAFNNTVAQKVAELKKAIDYEKNKQQSAFDDRNKTDHFAEDSMEMDVRNREYEKIILKVKALRLKIQRLKDGNTPRAVIEELLLQVHDEVARGLTYANEVYATEGAVLHTVFGNQGAKKELAKRKKNKEDIVDVQYLLTKEQYLQSLNENVGDTLHSLKHNAHDPQYAIYRAGKYIARLCDAADNLITKAVAETIPGYKNLLEIGTKSVEEKGKLAGKDPLAVRESGSSFVPGSFFAQYEAGDMSLVKSWAMGLGAKAAAMYKK